MSGYLAMRLMYWMALLGVLGVLLGTYLVLTKTLSTEHPIRRFLEEQKQKGMFYFAQKLAVSLLALWLLAIVVMYG